MRTALTATAAALLLCCTGCGDETGSSSGPGDYDSELQAPDASDYTEGSETDPDAEGGLVELEVSGGAKVVLWIDPDEITTVYRQTSDPDDPDAWTAPEVLFTAGAGCLNIRAATVGDTVAATLECYEIDPFIQQAPDEGQAVVTTDLADWQVHPHEPELYDDPVLNDDGTEVTWLDGDVTWTEADGFSDS